MEEEPTSKSTDGVPAPSLPERMIPPPPLPETKHVEDLMAKSLSHYHRHRYKDAKLVLEQALKAVRQIASQDDASQLLLARVLGNLANTSKELLDYDNAVTLYEEALQVFARVGDKKREGIILFNAAFTYKTMRNWQDVIRLMEYRLTLGDALTEDVVKKAQDLLSEAHEAIETQRKADELKQLQQQLYRAKLLVQSRQDNKALLKLTQVYAEAEQCTIVQIQANCLVQLARVHFRIGQKEAALDELNRACALHRACKEDPKGEHTALGDLAALLISTQRSEQAIAVLQQKVELTTNEQERIELITRITQMRADVNAVEVVVPAASQFINSMGGNRSEGELQLQRAELDAKRERELMQLCFKDIPFHGVLQRAEQAQQTLDQLIPLLRTTAEGEDQYGKILLSGLLQTNVAANFFGVGNNGTEKAKFKEPGTLGKALNTIRHDVHVSSEEARQLAGQMQDSIIHPLTKHKEHLKAATKRLNVLALRSSTALKKATYTVDQAKSVHSKLYDSVEKTRKQLEAVDPKSKDFTKKQITLSNKLNKLVVQREEAKDKIRQAIDQKEMQECTHSADIISLADDYQRAEIMRIDVVKEHMLDIVKLQLRAMDKRRKRLLTVVNAVESIDSTSDVRLYAHNRCVQNMLTRSRAKSINQAQKTKSSDGSGKGGKGGSGGSGVGSGTSIGGRRRGSSDPHKNDHDQHYESSHRLLKEIVMGLFADAELNDTNFQKKTIEQHEAAKREAVQRKEEEEKVRQEQKGQAKENDTSLNKNNENNENNQRKDPPPPPLSIKSIDDINANVKDYSALFHHESNRTMFVKLLNLQRSKVQDVGIGYNALSTLMCNYLDCCAKQSDVRSAKMIMIMSETFYRNRTVIVGKTKTADPHTKAATKAAMARAALQLEGRTDTREYLQTHIRQHEIWHNPHFWEEAFFMSCREEVRKHMERASELAAQKPEEFQRVYVNICFGQLGSYALNMINFGVSIEMTRLFVEKMASVNNLNQDQKQMLIENANAVAMSAIAAGENRRDSVVAPKFSESPRRISASGSVGDGGGEDVQVEYM